MIIKNNSNLEDSLKYYNDILDCNKEVILLDFREAEYIRNNHLALLGLALENQKKDGKEIEIKEPKIIKNRKSFELSGFMQHFSNLDNNNNIYEISSIVKYTNISLDDWFVQYNCPLVCLLILIFTEYPVKITNLSQFLIITIL